MEDWLGVIAILVVCVSVGFLLMWVIHITKRAPEGTDETEGA